MKWLFLLFSTGLVAAPTVKVCLTGSTVKVIPAYGEAFENGAKLAAIEPAENGTKIRIERHFYDPTPLSPLKAIERMKNAGCTVVVGFSSQNHLLSVRKFVQKNRMVVLSIYGELNDKFEGIPHIMTMQPSPEYLVQRLGKYLDRRFSKRMKNVLIATSVDRHSLKRYRDVFLAYFRKRRIQPDTVGFIERSVDLPRIKNFIAEKGKVYDTVVTLGKALNSAKVADLVYDIQKKKPLIIGTKNFGSAQLPAFLKRIKHKKMEAYFSRHSCLCDPDPQYQSYLKKYREIYNKNPMVISGHAYDAINYIKEATKYLNTKKNFLISPAAFLEAAKKASFMGITGVSLGPQFETTFSKYFVVQVQPTTYRLVDPIGKGAVPVE